MKEMMMLAPNVALIKSNVLALLFAKSLKKSQ